jgi:hypothetical protein
VVFVTAGHRYLEKVYACKESYWVDQIPVKVLGSAPIQSPIEISIIDQKQNSFQQKRFLYRQKIPLDKIKFAGLSTVTDNDWNESVETDTYPCHRPRRSPAKRACNGKAFLLAPHYKGELCSTFQIGMIILVCKACI